MNSVVPSPYETQAESKNIYNTATWLILFNQFSSDHLLDPLCQRSVWAGNRSFPSYLLSLCQNKFKCETILNENAFHLQLHFHPNQTCFYKKRFARRLVLKQRRKVSPLFSSRLKPLYQSEAWCSTIYMKMNLLCILYLHKSHNTPLLPQKNLHRHCFRLLLGHVHVPGEIANNEYAKFWGG